MSSSEQKALSRRRARARRRRSFVINRGKISVEVDKKADPLLAELIGKYPSLADNGIDRVDSDHDEYTTFYMKDNRIGAVALETNLSGYDARTEAELMENRS